jgi:stalled ribosome alternative rescue factor ArfA
MEVMAKPRGQRKRTVTKRNPIARALRDAAFRARAEANRRKYTRKRKHPAKPLEDASCAE